MCTVSNGKEVERHKVCFGLRKDQTHDNILHGVGAVYEKKANGQLINLTKQNRLTKKQRREQRESIANNTSGEVKPHRSGGGYSINLQKGANMQIERRVREIAAEQFECDVTNDSTLESLGADELDRFEFALSLEDEFDVSLDDDAIMQLDTIQGFIDLVVNLKVA